MAEGKYYWLKLQRDFFKRHDIRIIEEMENGKDYLLFYLKLLVESIDHEGNLRFSDTVPYNEKMLSVVTNTNLDIVRTALKVFEELKMVEVLDDNTIYMTEVQRMIGSASDNDNAKRQQRFRERKKAEITALPEDALRKVTGCVTKSNESKSIEIELEKDKEHIPAPKEPKRSFGEFGKVKLKESEYQKLVAKYGQEKADTYIRFLDEYIERKGYKAKSHYLCIGNWVVDAVAERERKKKPEGKYGSMMQNDIDFSALEKKLLE